MRNSGTLHSRRRHSPRMPSRHVVGHPRAPALADRGVGLRHLVRPRPLVLPPRPRKSPDITRSAHNAHSDAALTGRNSWSLLSTKPRGSHRPAIDVGGFCLSDGGTVTVKEGCGSPEWRATLRRLREAGGGRSPPPSLGPGSTRCKRTTSTSTWRRSAPAPYCK